MISKENAVLVMLILSSIGSSLCKSRSLLNRNIELSTVNREPGIEYGTYDTVVGT